MSLTRRLSLIAASVLTAAGLAVLTSPSTPDPRADTSWGRVAPGTPEEGGGTVGSPERDPITGKPLPRPTKPKRPGTGQGS